MITGIFGDASRSTMCNKLTASTEYSLDFVEMDEEPDFEFLISTNRDFCRGYHILILNFLSYPTKSYVTNTHLCVYVHSKFIGFIIHTHIMHTVNQAGRPLIFWNLWEKYFFFLYFPRIYIAIVIEYEYGYGAYQCGTSPYG